MVRWLLIVGALLLPFNTIASIRIESSRLLVDERLEVAAGSYSYFELRLSGGTKLVTKFAVSGGFNNRLHVWLLDLHNYQLFQSGQRYSYHESSSGTVEHLAQYTFTIPATGLYYLIFDNRHALMLSRTAHANVYAIERTPGPEHQKDSDLYDALYNQFLRRLFEFEEFDVTVRVCGMENAFSNPNITMCRELIDRNESQGIAGANIFVFFHEVAHSLLKIWGYPLWDNEDVADEMATVLAVLIKKEELALQAAQWWASSGSRQEALSKMVIDDRHTISPQRARNIVNWLNRKGELLQRWQKIWVPHMTQEALIAMRDSHDEWVDKQLVLKALDGRAKPAATAVSLPSTSREASAKPASLNGIVGKWRGTGGPSALTFEFRADGTWSARANRSRFSGNATGKWNLTGNSFTGHVEESTISALRKGRRWNDEVTKLTTSEFIIRNHLGLEEKYERID